MEVCEIFTYNEDNEDNEDQEENVYAVFGQNERRIKESTKRCVIINGALR